MKEEEIPKCPKCNDLDYIGIYDEGKKTKMGCLNCDFEE